MKFKNQLVVLLAGAACFTIFVFILFKNNYSDKYERIILPAPIITEQTPIGELTNGIRFKQSINWNSIRSSEFEKSNTLCINILMANYNNPKITGTFSLTLETGNFSKRIIFDAHSVQDNSYENFCYDNLLLHDVVNKPATLILEGIDSPPGKAVTAWTTSNTSQGMLSQGDKVLNSSLIFSIHIISDSNKKKLQAIFLAILCGFSILILFLPTRLKSS